MSQEKNSTHIKNFKIKIIPKNYSTNNNNILSILQRPSSKISHGYKNYTSKIQSPDFSRKTSPSRNKNNIPDKSRNMFNSRSTIMVTDKNLSNKFIKNAKPNNDIKNNFISISSNNSSFYKNKNTNTNSDERIKSIIKIVKNKNKTESTGNHNKLKIPSINMTPLHSTLSNPYSLNSVYKKHKHLTSQSSSISIDSNSNLNNVKDSNKLLTITPLNEIKSESQNKILFDNSNYFKYANLESAKKSGKPLGNVVSFGVNTNFGIIRDYNEDRVSIILNLVNQSYSTTNKKWPHTSFFAIYDGHGGNKCADFLKENLHQYIFRDKNILTDPKSAILKGFEEAEKKFLELAWDYNKYNNDPNFQLDKSGSCALVMIIIESDCYIANLGDSRAILSENRSSNLYKLTKDHKPNDSSERERIENSGGNIYQVKYTNPITNKVDLGPFRISPGKLSVSRSIGDVEAKLIELGGQPGVLSAIPEVKSFKITPSTDFIILGCDGIFDKLSNADVIHSVWAMASENSMGFDINDHCARCTDNIIRNCLGRNATDNLTCIVVAFENFKNSLFSMDNYIDSEAGNTISLISRLKIKSISHIKKKLKFLEDSDFIEKDLCNIRISQPIETINYNSIPVEQINLLKSTDKEQESLNLNQNFSNVYQKKFLTNFVTISKEEKSESVSTNKLIRFKPRLKCGFDSIKKFDSVLPSLQNSFFKKKKL